MWSVVSFDENTKLYTVSNEESKTCRATSYEVVYGLDGTKLKYKPVYNAEVCSTVMEYQIASCLGNMAHFAYDLILYASKYNDGDIGYPLFIAKNHMDIMNDLESLDKVRKVPRAGKHRETWPTIHNLFRNLVTDSKQQRADFEQFHKYIRALIEVTNCDDDVFYSAMTDGKDKSRVIESVKNYKRLRGITLPAIDDDLMNVRKKVAYRYLAKYPDFAIQLLTKPIIDDMMEVLYKQTILNMIEEFVDNCEALGVEPKFKGNLIAQMASMRRQARIAKEKEKLENLRKAAESYSWLNKFSCNGLGVVVLGTPEEFEKEGDEQHSCVARYGYLESMVKGECVICGVRKLEDMSSPYITCELTPFSDGTLEVKQFFHAFNHYADSEDEKEFLREFKKFINR